MLCFTDAAQVEAAADLIADFLAQAKTNAEQGHKVKTLAPLPQWPEELTEALADDPEFADGFYSLTQGRQRGWLLHINATKKRETRPARITKGRENIMAGNGATER